MDKDKQQKQPSEIDLELLQHNLSLSYEERLLEHQRALDLLLELEKAGRDFYDKQSE